MFYSSFKSLGFLFALAILSTGFSASALEREEVVAKAVEVEDKLRSLSDSSEKAVRVFCSKGVSRRDCMLGLIRLEKIADSSPDLIKGKGIQRFHLSHEYHFVGGMPDVHLPVKVRSYDAFLQSLPTKEQTEKLIEVTSRIHGQLKENDVRAIVTCVWKGYGMTTEQCLNRLNAIDTIASSRALNGLQFNIIYISGENGNSDNMTKYVSAESYWAEYWADEGDVLKEVIVN